MNPRAPNLHEHKTQKNMDLRAQDVFPRTDKKCEHKAPKILRAEGESRSMFCECIWGGGAAPSPPTPLQLFFFRPTSSAGTAHPHLKLKRQMHHDSLHCQVFWMACSKIDHLRCFTWPNMCFAVFSPNLLHVFHDRWPTEPIVICTHG